MKQPPLIAHIIFRLDFGGLENGLVNLINNMPDEKYRHAIICVSDYTDFRKRIHKSNVEVYALHKKPGNDLGVYFRLWKLLRKLKPTIVHTRNLGTIEYSIPAMFAGVKYRIHGEHGRDMSDIDGTNKKYIFLRRFYNLFLHRFVALSKDLERWLLNSVGINSKKVAQLYNGVDLRRFNYKVDEPSLLDEYFKLRIDDLLIGTVGRLQAEKDQATLIKAFALAIDNLQKHNVKLLIIGDGPEKQALEDIAAKTGVSESVIFLGARDDIPNLLTALDIFVLPSRGEGISNTILEAMACGLPVIATKVGGNPELVDENVTGLLVPVNNSESMAEALLSYIKDTKQVKRHGLAGRKRVEALFSLDKMIENYTQVYDSLLVTNGK